MKANVVSLYPDRAPAVFPGHLGDQKRLQPHDLEHRREDIHSVAPMENTTETADERGESGEADGSLMGLSVAQTKRPVRLVHRQPRFQIKAFLSNAGAGRTIVHAPEKQTLFEQGERGNAVFYILVGTVKITVVSQDKEITIGLLGPGNFAGKECVATVPGRRTASARTLTDCTIVKIERKEMLRVIQHERTFAAFFLDYLLDRVNRDQDVIVDQLINTSEKRLARALLLLANFGNGGKPEEVVPQIHQEELAEMVGTTRSRICFFMNRFRKLGFVAYKGHSGITIRAARLARFVA